jgi:hypothetical protein
LKRKAKIIAVAIITATINFLLIRNGYKIIDYRVIFVGLVTTEFIVGYNVGIRNKTIKSGKQRVIGEGFYYGGILTIIGALIFFVKVIVNWRG